LPDRRLFKLREYFLRFPYEVRARVETVVTDLYSPYMILVKEVFPNAKIIIDRFHVILQVNRALNQTRIQVMNGLRKASEPKDRRDYTKLKNYWKLLLMDQDKLDFTNFRYHRLFKKGMCDKDVVDYLLGIDLTLKANYDAYQTIKYAVNHKEHHFTTFHAPKGIKIQTTPNFLYD
ncbi:MAG: transposase, partial [Trichococcus flocculiformis]